MKSAFSIRRSLACAGVVALLCEAVVLAGNSPSFNGTGFIQENSQSIAYGVSRDGNVVIGESIAPEGFEAFRWTADGGIVGLGFFDNPGGFKSSMAFATNQDGSVIVGTSLRPHALLEDGAAFRWTQATGLQWLGNLGGTTDTGGEAFGVTADGSVIVGFAASGTGYHAFRWTEANGMQGIGTLVGEQLGKALAVSDDGNTIVGYSSVNSTTFPQATIWTSETGLTLLPTLNSGAISAANAITADASIIVGQSGGRAAMWSDGIVTSLGELPGGLPSSTYSAYGISADGSLIVGLGNFNPGQETGEAFIWTPTGGMQSLMQYIGAQGIDLDGWFLFAATGVSSDGKVIVGYGFDPLGYQEGWVLDLRTPVNCLGDLNHDSTIDLTDLTILLANYGSTSATADMGDLDADLDVDLTDLATFLTLYGKACP